MSCCTHQRWLTSASVPQTSQSLGQRDWTCIIKSVQTHFFRLKRLPLPASEQHFQPHCSIRRGSIHVALTCNHSKCCQVFVQVPEVRCHVWQRSRHFNHQLCFFLFWWETVVFWPQANQCPSSILAIFTARNLPVGCVVVKSGSTLWNVTASCVHDSKDAVVPLQHCCLVLRACSGPKFVR